MVTAIGFELNIKLSQQMGATAYVTKPFAPKELLDKIQQILATPEVQVDLSED
jgi:DNA-binding response OmpR family regulator